MSDQIKSHRLSDTVVPGVDFAAKVKIVTILDREVEILSIEKVSGSPEFNLVDPDTGDITSRDYWNVEVRIDRMTYTFSTGAVPIDKVLTALQHKLNSGEAELPLLATFCKEGRTYVVK